MISFEFDQMFEPVTHIKCNHNPQQCNQQATYRSTEIPVEVIDENLFFHQVKDEPIPSLWMTKLWSPNKGVYPSSKAKMGKFVDDPEDTTQSREQNKSNPI
ncbi:syntaxin 5 [Sesbania bispinosa]|nr:syntaxin 5 [Sesbania bispinosa]